MKTEKQVFTDLLENNGKDAAEINDFISESVALNDQSECYEHLTYCFLYSGLTSAKDLIIKAKDYVK